MEKRLFRRAWHMEDWLGLLNQIGARPPKFPTSAELS
jgi:hypothetical protein